MVTDCGTESIDGEDYHYIMLDGKVKVGEMNCEVGDNIVMLGHRGNDAARQKAIYIAAYNSIDETLTAPLFAQYTNINDFVLKTIIFLG